MIYFALSLCYNDRAKIFLYKERNPFLIFLLACDVRSILGLRNQFQYINVQLNKKLFTLYKIPYNIGIRL